MIIKFNSKELKSARKELIKDISKQEIRKQIHSGINDIIKKDLEKRIGQIFSGRPYSMPQIIEKTLNTEVRKMAFNMMKEHNIKVTNITKDELIEKINISDLINEVKKDIRKKVLENLK